MNKEEFLYPLPMGVVEKTVLDVKSTMKRFIISGKQVNLVRLLCHHSISQEGATFDEMAAAVHSDIILGMRPRSNIPNPARTPHYSTEGI